MSISPLPENVLPAGADTVLTISGLGGFQYQARGLSQTLSVIKQAEQQLRTINATLKDISDPAFRKFESKITCTDINVPPFDGLWPGMIVTVHCAAVLSYHTGNPGSPWRTAVSGSSWTLGAMTFYRPTLTMMVKVPTVSFDEWKSAFQWDLGLEEV